jgi:hypothetical protein
LRPPWTYWVRGPQPDVDGHNICRTQTQTPRARVMQPEL